jgi:adenine-specific DNA-methyltransferase
VAKENNNIPTGLYWQGKRTEVERISLPFQTIETINESRATREKEKDTLLHGLKKKEELVWHNRLIWGDNKYVMSSLIDEFAGQIDLIYIDPPFATGADFSVKIEVGDVEWIKEASAIEEKAYRDTWGKGLDSYLQMMYDRLVLMRDLLSERGSIIVHLDWHIGQYVKVLMDELFGKTRFRNEIIWCYTGPGSPGMRQFNRKHDNLYWFTKADKWIFEDQNIRIPHHEKTKENFRKGLEGSGFVVEDYELDAKGKIPEDWWELAVASRYPIDGVKRTGYDTEKPWPLIERIVSGLTEESSLVGDFFCGSGTTAAVAEKLGRRWIMCDIGRYAIHTTRKRMLGIEACKPFVVQNLGKYERQYWQGVTFTNRKNEQKPIYEYIKFILDLYHAEPITGCLWIHGKKGKNLIHVGAVDAPVTLSDIESAIDECKKMKQSSLDILGWEWEMGLHDVIQDIARTKGINLSLKYIPREVMDPRAVAAGDITFYELAYLEVDLSRNKHGEFVVELKDFVIPNHDLIPEEVRSKIKKWSDYIDYWSIDWDFNNDTFHNMWQSYRTRKDRTLLLKSDPHLYEKKGKHPIMIKVIDIFGNDTTRIAEVTS